MSVVDSWFSCKDTDATANIEQADLVEFEEVPSQGLGTSTRRLRNRNRDTPVAVLHDGGGKQGKVLSKALLMWCKECLDPIIRVEFKWDQPLHGQKGEVIA